MDDGTVLRADVYYPTNSSGAAAKGPFPSILTQTPYGKSSGSAASFPGGEQLAGLSGYNPYLVKRGYIDVIADVRGTGASQGSWGLFDPVQGRDGAELVRWAAGLSHASGKVGTLGASYLGIDQLFTAANLGPGSPLKAMFPIISANDVYRDTAFGGGLLDSEFGGIFLGLTAGLNLANPLLESFLEQPSNPDALQVLAQHIGGLLAFHASLVANVETGGDQGYDESYWRARRPRSILHQIVSNRIPAFLVGGWFDLFQRGEPLNYSDLQNLQAGRGVGLPMKPGQQASGRYQLMMGPWYHVTAGEGIDMDRLELSWFDRWLKGEDTGIDKTKSPLHLYQLGSGNWLNASHYPLEEATPKTYYLGPGKSLGATKPGASGGSDPLVWTGRLEPLRALDRAVGGRPPPARPRAGERRRPVRGRRLLDPGGAGCGDLHDGAAPEPEGAGRADRRDALCELEPPGHRVRRQRRGRGAERKVDAADLGGAPRLVPKARRIADVVGERRKAADALPRLHARLSIARSDRPDDPLRHRGIPDLRQARRRPPPAGHDHHLRRPASAADPGPDGQPGRRRLLGPAQGERRVVRRAPARAGQRLHEALRALPLGAGGRRRAGRGFA